jgi:hypothetical protein
MKSSVVTLGVRNRNALYLSLYNVARLPIMELPAATGAITAEPASLETNVKLFAFRVPFETARTPVMVILPITNSYLNVQLLNLLILVVPVLSKPQDPKI